MVLPSLEEIVNVAEELGEVKVGLGSSSISKQNFFFL